MNWRFAYNIDFHPWEDAAKDPAFVAKATELFEREERDREPPYELALDLGTGSGIWGIELAKRGWQVTGVDIVDKALTRARRRVEQAGVEMRIIKADVTALTRTGLGSGYRLVNARKRLGLSQAALGNALGLTQTYVSMMERGKYPIEPRTALSIKFLLLERETPHDKEKGSIAPAAAEIKK